MIRWRMAIDLVELEIIHADRLYARHAAAAAGESSDRDKLFGQVEDNLVVLLAALATDTEAASTDRFQALVVELKRLSSELGCRP